MIHGWIHAGEPKDFAWDVVMGTSVGAINASIVGLYPKHSGEAMSDYIADYWSSLNTRDVFAKWKPNSGRHLSKYDSSKLEGELRRRMRETLNPYHGYRR